ncbi:unnamed protein product [Allacma fusca]|uniref:DUF5641 domain-containing protein n=1 Tax=Allacma fusca TaxID=39272 RepID=A0A8J2PRN4_9HEXA|nr:unnamed protein product [Allacma fusca]
MLNYKDMYKVLTQVEACLNSRPLTQLSSDPNDLSALTPGPFLVGDAMNAIREDNLSQETTSHLSKWKQMQRAVQIFWKRWSMEYLCRLQQRPKWMFKQPSLQIGDLVLLRDERLPPLKWKLARMIDIHPGPDLLVRIFTIKTSDGTLKRHLSKLCPLPIDTNN